MSSATADTSAGNAVPHEDHVPSPLRLPLFRAFWVAGILSNLGSWVHLVAAAWLMTSLTHSAAPVALLLTASSVPTFLLSLPAGALADVIDRRLLIIVTQALQVVAAGALAALALADAATPDVLLLLTLVLAVGSTLGTPVLQAVIPDLVAREQLPAAVALNSTSFTLSQAAGPALGGVLVGLTGPGVAFAFNAVSFLAVVVVAVMWRPARRVAALPAEHVLGAMRAGARYVAHAPALTTVLVRIGCYALSFSVIPALLAVISRERLGGTAAQYGMLLGCLGVGGLAGSLLLPRLRARVNHELLVAAALGVYLLALVTLAGLRSLLSAFPVLLVAGLAGMTIMSTFNIAAQSVLPTWVRGRGLAVYQLVFAVTMAAGAAAWGFVAERAGLSTALIAAAGGMLLNILLSLKVRLSIADDVDTRPLHAETPLVRGHIDPGDGPVLVVNEYRIPLDQVAAFRRAMEPLKSIRRRDGAMHWSLYHSLNEPDLHLESFLVASWPEYERLTQRGIASDAPIIAGVGKLDAGAHRAQSHRFLGHHFKLFH